MPTAPIGPRANIVCVDGSGGGGGALRATGGGDYMSRTDGADNIYTLYSPLFTLIKTGANAPVFI